VNDLLNCRRAGPPDPGGVVGVAGIKTVVGIRFKQAGKIYYFDPRGQEYAAGDEVIVETSRGLEYGQVVVDNREVEDEEIVSPLKPIVRRATEEDRRRLEANEAREREALAICQKKIEEHGLEMSLVDVEYTFDGGKIIFYFTADGRVDFRALVRDLAAAFRTRIELRQIGVRDEAKMIGGLGPCGRPLCCVTFLNEFEPISIRMAKQQNLSLNPVKISGLCGRLMCCLRFEDRCYREIKSELPKVGEQVTTDQGTGKVTGQNIVKETVTVRLDNGDAEVEFDPEGNGAAEDGPAAAPATEGAAEPGGTTERQDAPADQSRSRGNGQGREQVQHQDGGADGPPAQGRKGRRRRARSGNRRAGGGSRKMKAGNRESGTTPRTGNRPRHTDTDTGTRTGTGTKSGTGTGESRSSRSRRRRGRRRRKPE